MSGSVVTVLYAYSATAVILTFVVAIVNWRKSGLALWPVQATWLLSNSHWQRLAYRIWRSVGLIALLCLLVTQIWSRG